MIKNIIKKMLNSNKYGKKIYPVLKDFKNCKYGKIDAGKKIYPEVLQMPITTKCNSKCVMCNIPNMDKNNEVTAEEFGMLLQDPIFKKVKAIGINGGEPFLLSNLEEYVKQAALNLPELKSINIISNGFLTDKIVSKAPIIYNICKQYGKSFELLFSLDGYGEIHDKVRGIPGAFKLVEKTLEILHSDVEKYADNIELGCTVVKQNVDYLIELDTFCKLKNYSIKYRLGIENNRIESGLVLDRFSVINDKKAKQTAEEFFWGKYLETNNIKYYSIFNFLRNGSGRLLGCDWKNNGITMDPKANIYYCAVASKKIGNLRNKKGEEIFFNNNNIEYRKELVSKQCDKCIHDYVGKMKFKDLVHYYKYVLNNKLCLKKFEKWCK